MTVAARWAACVAAAIALASSGNAQARSFQEDFDSASADVVGGRCDSAVATFDALERSGRMKAGSLPAAAVDVRKGQCLVKLGRTAEGESAIERGLPVLAAAGKDFDVDVSDAETVLGSAAAARWDYARAAAAYRRALARQAGFGRIAALAQLARVTAFDGGPEPLAVADEGLALVAGLDKPDKALLAVFHTLHARILLNQGRNADAYKELKTVLKLNGGLTLQTSLAEAAMRSDLAIAALRNGRKDDARLYLAYTGAGRMGDVSFARAAIMAPPPCGEEAGLRPEDFAVVEFSIGTDGTVAASQPVFSSGGPAVAAAFAEAVANWRWLPESIAKVPAFYRALTRIELRCTASEGSGPGIMGPLNAWFEGWATQHLPADDTVKTTADRIKALETLVQDGQRDRRPFTRIAALLRLARLPSTPVASRLSMIDEALALAQSSNAPARVAGMAQVARLEATQATRTRRGASQQRAWLALSTEPLMASDALLADTVRLIAASAPRTKAIREAPELLMAVATDDRLEAHHPLRQLAWLRLANKAAEDGLRDQARDYFARTGLTEQQCAILGAPPALRRSGADSSDYPRAALMMGFEGWVQLEYDIAADGRTVNARPIVAYPPFVFADAATGMARDMRYDTSFREGGSVACNASWHTINFLIP